MEFENVEIEKVRINSIRVSEDIYGMDFDDYELNYTITVNATVFVKAAWQYEAFSKRIGIKGTERKIFYVENKYMLGDDMSLQLLNERINYPNNYDDNHFYKRFMKTKQGEDSYYGYKGQYGDGYEDKSIEEIEQKIELWSSFKEKMFDYIIEEMKIDGFKIEDVRNEGSYGNAYDMKYYF